MWCWNSFLRLYVGSEPVKFRVDQRRVGSAVAPLCQLVNAEKDLSVRQIIFLKNMKVHLNLLHWEFLNSWATVRLCSSTLLLTRSFVLSLSFVCCLVIYLFVFFYCSLYIICTQSDWILYKHICTRCDQKVPRLGDWKLQFIASV